MSTPDPELPLPEDSTRSVVLPGPDPEATRSVPAPRPEDATRSALPAGPSPGDELHDLVHEATRRYEQAWRDVHVPKLADFLPQTGAARRAVLGELVLMDLERRRAAGLPASAEFYLDAFPELSADPETVAELKRLELVQPTETGLAPAGYEILGELGEGGMGTVYKARQLRLNRVVALKLISRADRASADMLLRFLAEAEAAAAVDHPNVVRVFESGHHAGRPYMAMELVEGGSLSDRLKAVKKLAPRDAARMLAQAARGVAAAHDLGIVHRDLKPSNILLAADGTPKVADFGLAKRTTGSDLTQTAAIMGTPAYMSPEQASGKTRHAGPTADVWALGVILYECLTGQRPFTASEDYQLLLKICNTTPPTPRSLSTMIPRDLDLICRKCLEKRPEDRYPNAQDLAEDLDRFLAGKPVSVTAAGPVERVGKWVRRNKVASGIMAASLLAAVSLGALAVWAVQESRRADAQANMARNESTRASEEKQRADEEAQKAIAEARESRRVLDLARLRTAQADWDSGNAGSAQEQLAAILPENRCLAWGILTRKFQGSEITLYGHSEGVRSVAISSDGRRIVTGSEDRTARMWDASTGQSLLELKGHSGSVYSVALSADGRRIVTGSRDKTARVWDAATGQSLLELKGHLGGVPIALSADGRRIVTGSYDNTARVWEAHPSDWEPGHPPTADEIARRRRFLAPDPDYHVQLRKQCEAEENPYAVAVHRSLEQRARGYLALDAGDVDRAWGHFIAEAALRPQPQAAEPPKR